MGTSNDHLLRKQLAINWLYIRQAKSRPQNNFPRDNAGVPQASGNFQDTHKILKESKKPNVRPDDKKTGNSWEAGAWVSLHTPHPGKNGFHESCLEKTWFTLIHTKLLQSPSTATCPTTTRIHLVKNRNQKTSKAKAEISTTFSRFYSLCCLRASNSQKRVISKNVQAKICRCGFYF